MREIFVGIDLGGTNIKIGCFDTSLKLLCKTAVATKADMGAEVVVEKICETAKKLLADNGLPLEAVKAAGIGAPGPSNIAEGIIVSAPNLPKFRNIPLRKMIGERLGRPIVFENDANAACWGEYVVGAGKGVRNMVFLTLGTGIGGGIISNGELVHGFNDNAAELGHIIIHPQGRLCGCGQKGCVEAYASASSTAARAAEAIEAGRQSSLKKTLEKNGEITCRDVFEHSAAGDTLAKEITDSTADALGLLCVDMLHVTGPQRIVFAGGMIAAGDLLLNRIRHFFKQHIWSLKKEMLEICFATLGGDAGVIGTAAMALRDWEQEKL
ncbi:MAG: hypothetical protein DRP62_08305 [Planctomycetota bacterium]|nr:MAG: hypothetical protein DRP62_08305 [Planctomycetota bacterium]